jgi:hypothetical protein
MYRIREEFQTVFVLWLSRLREKRSGQNLAALKRRGFSAEGM